MKLIKLILLFTLMTASTTAFAGVRVTPDRHIVELSPGETETVSYQVYNSGKSPLDIVIEPQSWSGQEDVYSWLSLDSYKLTVDKESTNTIKVNIKVPLDAKGESVGMLFLCYKEDDGSQLNIRNGIPLYMVVKGTEQYNLDILSIKARYAKVKNFKDLNIEVMVKNSGNIHIKPDIEVIIEDQEGIQVKRLRLDAPKIVLREQYHTYKLGWRKPTLRRGNYTIKTRLVYEDKIDEYSQRDFKVNELGLVMADKKVNG